MKRKNFYILGLIFFIVIGNLFSDNTNKRKIEKKQFIILKADDLKFDSINTISQRWQMFINYVEDIKIKASIGIIGNSLEKGNDKYISLLKKIHNRGNIEFWNHGYEHYSNNDTINPVFEFKNSPYGKQYENLIKTQELAKTRLGIILHTFGAPYNKIDKNTFKSIENINDIKVWLFGDSSSTKLALKRYCNIEYPTHYPNFQKFLENYNSGKEYLVLQLHPNSWDEERFNQFKKVIEFLLKNDIIFIKLFEYYQLINKINSQ